MEEANEVQEALSRSYGTPEIDEDELDAGSVCVCVRACVCVCMELRASLFSSVAELDALGDELLLDDDSSYLDEASSAPSIPEGMPSDTKTNKVQVTFFKLSTTKYSFSLVIICLCDLLRAYLYLYFSGWRSGGWVWPSTDPCHIRICSLISVLFTAGGGRFSCADGIEHVVLYSLASLAHGIVTSV